MQGVRFDSKPSQDGEKDKKRRKKRETRVMFIKHYAHNRCLCIKVANSIDHWVEDCRDVTKAGGRGDMYKDGSYCERKKK